ncbi:MAG: signal peptidase II [Flavobacteriaceae bacterium]|nr:signal peptidase II [Flavobacteriaceae bacterium]
MTRIIIILSLVFLNIGCDQISKRIVRQKIAPNERISVIKHNLILTKVENSGAAYSLGSDLSPMLKTIVLQVIPAIVLLLLLGLLLVKKEYEREIIFGFCFIVGGGIGNIFDRIAYGSVTDFVYVDLGFFATEIFNMADVSIVFGTLVVLIYSIFGKKEAPNLKENIA